MNKKQSPAILIAYPSSFYAEGWGVREQLKSSQLLLASYMARFFPVEYADFAVSIGNPNSSLQVKRFERNLRQYFEEHDFDILALSCWASLSYTATLSAARIFRELYPRRLIVVGGYHPSALPEDFIFPGSPVDYVIRGEGENALLDIAREYPNTGRPPSTQIITAPVFHNEQFVGYDWDLFTHFARNHYPEGLPNLFLYLSRGCPFGCSFCMEPLKDKSWRAYPPERALEEMVSGADRFKSIGVAICDACFGKKSSWRKEFLRLLAEARPNFWTIFETRPEYLDDEDIAYLAQIKTEIQFGLESGSPEILQLMRKTKQPQKFLDKFAEISHKLSRQQILHRANLIFNHPGETRKTLSETFAYIDKLISTKDSCLMWATAGYMHFPGCDLYYNHEYYEQKFGSKFLGGEWWKKQEDQFLNSTLNEPSGDLSGANVNLWKEMFADRAEQMKAALAPFALKFAASKYFLEWQDDPRYRQN